MLSQGMDIPKESMQWDGVGPWIGLRKREREKKEAKSGDHDTKPDARKIKAKKKDSN